MNPEIIVFDDTISLYRFLRETDSLRKLDMFLNTPYTGIPKDNTGYVIMEGEEVVGAASLYDEGCGRFFNEIFEIAPEYRGKGYARVLYEYMKEDSMANEIHGFCTNDENQSFWEHMGQKCINPEMREMLEICKKETDDIIL